MPLSLESTEPVRAEIPALRPAAGDRTVRLALGLVILAGLVTNARSLTYGFLYDDFAHQMVLRGQILSSWLRPWNLYDFGPLPGPGDLFVNRGFHPWWTDDDFKVRFFRPISSLSIMLDYWLYDDWGPGYHLTSLALFVVFLLLVFRLYRVLGAPAGVALWALAFVALDDVYAFPVGWVANRNTLLAGLFVTAAVLAALRQRRTGRFRDLIPAGMLFLLGCGSKESGIVAFPLVALYLLVLDPAVACGPFLARLRAAMRCPVLWVFAGLAVGYLTFYVAAGYGTRSDMYLTPWDETGRYLVKLAILCPMSAVNLFLGLPSDIVILRPQYMGPILALAIPLCIVCAVPVVRVLRRRPLAGFALGWLALSLTPEAGVHVLSRLYVNATIGSALLMGLYLHEVGPVRRLLRRGPYSHRVIATWFLLANVVGPIGLTVFGGGAVKRMTDTDKSIILAAEMERRPSRPQTVFLLNSPSSLIPITMLTTWSFTTRDQTTSMNWLQFGRRPLTWTREDARTMTLTSRGMPFLVMPLEQLFCTRGGPPPVGTVYRSADYTATVAAVDADGVRSVRFVLNKNLDDESCRFLAWQDGRMARVSPPPVGGTVELAEVIPLSSLSP